MRLIFGFCLFVLLGLLAGCATLSKAQCETGDWRAIGQADGAAGYPLSRLAEHSEACTKHGYRVDEGLYKAGRDLGLRAYCTTDNAAKVGLQGKSYHNVCQGEIGLSFARIHREANDVYSIDQDISEIQIEISAKTEQLVNPKLTQEQRAKLSADIKKLNRDLTRLFDRRAREEAELRQVMLEEQRRLS
jgi:hypothetical protein